MSPIHWPPPRAFYKFPGLHGSYDVVANVMATQESLNNVAFVKTMLISTLYLFKSSNTTNGEI